MFNTSYEEYMRTVLGYTPNGMQNNIYESDYYIMPNNIQMNEASLNDLYPDMYKKVYPIICNECEKNTMPLTVEILEQMTDNVLKQVDIDLKIQTNIKLDTKRETRKIARNKSKKRR